MKKNSCKEKLNCILTAIAAIIEVLVAIVIVVIAGAMLVKIGVQELFEGAIVHMSILDFSELLSALLIITVGLEFVKLLIRHRFEDVVDVVMLAIARQMVVEHLSMVNMLIGVVSITILFGIKRFLFLRGVGEGASKKKIAAEEQSIENITKK